MTERKHISLVDPEGKAFKVYAGIPTILPKGSYTLNEPLINDIIIIGETDKIKLILEGCVG